MYSSRIFDFEPFFASVVDRTVVKNYVYDNEKRTLSLDIPGIDPASVSVDADPSNGKVTIVADNKKYFAVFEDLDPDAVTATLKFGRLVVTAPKQTKTAKKTVKVEIG